MDRAILIEEMWASISQAVDQTLTIIIHAQAMADAAEVGVDVLADPAVADLAATRLYLAEPVRPFIDLLRQTPPILKPRDARDLEGELVRVGSEVYLEIWRRLGIPPRDLPRPQVYLDVQDPIR